MTPGLQFTPSDDQARRGDARYDARRIPRLGRSEEKGSKVSRYPPKGKFNNNTNKQIMPGLLAAAAVAAPQLISQGVNAIFQGRANRKARQWAEHMYGVQRQHALEDWNRQNEYNSPVNQMARLKEAGLNPRLVYDNGATQMSGNIRSSDTGSWRPEPPQFDLGSVVNQGLQAYMDMQTRELQWDNMKKQNQVMDLDTKLKAAQVIATLNSAESTGVTTEQKRFDLNMKNALKETSLEAATVDLQKKYADLNYTLNENERRQAMTSANLSEAVERILTQRSNRETSLKLRQKMDVEIDNLKKDGKLKDFDVKLTEAGVRPGDPAWMRMLAQIVKSINDKISGAGGLSYSLNKGIIAPPGHPSIGMWDWIFK